MRRNVNKMSDYWECAEEKNALFASRSLLTHRSGRGVVVKAVEGGRNEGDVCRMARSPNPV